MKTKNVLMLGGIFGVGYYLLNRTKVEAAVQKVVDRTKEVINEGVISSPAPPATGTGGENGKTEKSAYYPTQYPVFRDALMMIFTRARGTDRYTIPDGSDNFGLTSVSTESGTHVTNIGKGHLIAVFGERGDFWRIGQNSYIKKSDAAEPNKVIMFNKGDLVTLTSRDITDVFYYDPNMKKVRLTGEVIKLGSRFKVLDLLMIGKYTVAKIGEDRYIRAGELVWTDLENLRI